MRPDRTPNQLFHADHQPIDIDRLGVQRLSPRKRQQTVSQRSGTLGGILRSRHVTVYFSKPPLAQARLEQFQRAGDAGQQVIEVVGDTARQLADSLHLLRLTQSFFGLGQTLLLAPPLADIIRKQLSANACPSALRRVL